MRYAGWSIIIDDIVFPDGRTAMGVLGGGGLYTTAGMRIWTPDAGVLANVGADFNPAVLARIGLGAEGLRVTSRPTPRAWQLFEEDGRRTQIPRIDLDDWAAQLAWAEHISDRLDGVRAAHLLVRGRAPDPEAVARIARKGVRLSLEPVIEEGMSRDQADRVLACLLHVEIFSPGIAETRVLLGERSPGAALQAFAERGPAIVALRQGAAGSLLYHRESERFLRAPAAPARVVDVTGAGNAYCGGLLVGWVEHGALDMAAAYAAVSAALTIEQVGPPAITPPLIDDAQRRLADVLAALEEVRRPLFD